ncbi:MAG: hypothetical protein J6Z01_05590 [Bacteroidales bacterium]|nr:hypothetical protein [Bacteroidales bacterium]
MKLILRTFVILLAAHLWYCNADLLILTRGMALNEGETLSTFTLVLLILFALSYSIMSAMSVIKMEKYIYVGIFSLLDGFVVYMRINIDQPYFLYICAGFYALYTAYLMTVGWLIAHPHNTPIPQPVAPATPQAEEKAKPKALPEGVDKAELSTAIHRINASKDKQRAITEIIATTSNENLKAYIRQRYSYTQTELAL